MGIACSALLSNTAAATKLPELMINRKTIIFMLESHPNKQNIQKFEDILQFFVVFSTKCIAHHKKPE
jgi:hypothetical protein